MELDKLKSCIVATLKWTLFPQDATPPPVCSTSELAQLIRFLLSRMGSEVAVLCSTHILENSLKDLLKQAMANFQASFQQLRSSIHEHSGPSPWVAMSRLISTSHHITPILHQFSSGLCDLISTFLQVAVTPSSHCDLTALLSTFQTSWNEHILRILSQVVSVLKLDPDLQWCHCLATVCVCLVASELCHVLRSKCGAERCANFLHLGQLPKILNLLDEIFPAALYSKYQEWEEQEVGGACEPVRLAEGGGVVFRSVDALVALLSTVATVAKGCGHQRLSKSIKECSLRLVNSSWQHIQQVSRQEHPVHTRYIALSSLLHLHALLKTLSASQEGWCADLLRILEGQASAAKERLIHYHTQLCLTCILQDSDGGGGDWQNCSPFLEGERCSYTVQMWAYHMQGLLHDLYKYLPLKCFLLREEIVLGVLGVCLSHLASRYSQLCPSSQRAELVLADVLVILTCTASVLHALGLEGQGHTPPVLSTVDVCCDTLLLVGAVVTASLEQLEKALSGSSQDSSAAGGCGWLEVVSEWQDRVCGEGRVAYPHLILPLHSSQYGCLLQALLSDGGAVCLGLCSKEEVWQGEGVVSHLLEVLLWCPHTVWALSSLCSRLPCRESEDGALSDVKPLQMPVVRKFLEQHLGSALHSHLLAKATSHHSNSKDLDMNAWCRGLLDGLQERIHTQLPRPLQALLYWMSGGNKESSTERLAKILIAAIKGCGLSCDPSHPCHPLILPTQRAFCFALDPTCLHTSLPLHLQEIIELRSDYHKSLLKSLLNPSLLLPKPSNPSTLLDADPSTLAREELSGCTLTEHTIAAEIITAQEKGLQALETVHLALRKQLNSDRPTEMPKYGVQVFNPMREYCNMAAFGTQQHMNQYELMIAAYHIDVIGVIRGANHDMALKLVKTARWEWQARGAADLTPAEQELVQRINSLHT